MSFARDQDAVGGLASARSDPALGGGVHPGHARQDGHHPGADGGEECVEALGEVSRVVPDEESDFFGACVIPVHKGVSGALGGPCGGDMLGDASDVDAAGVVLDEEEDEQAPQENGVDMEDIDGEDARGLGLEEPGPRPVAALRRWIDPGALQDLPYGEGGGLPAQARVTWVIGTHRARERPRRDPIVTLKSQFSTGDKVVGPLRYGIW
ncbi:hypothetical protein ACWGDS_00045 [Streptomyces sp. NPDC055059]